MHEQMLVALIELIKTGGNIGLWGIFIWQFIPVMKVGIIGLFVWLTARECVHAIKK